MGTHENVDIARRTLEQFIRGEDPDGLDASYEFDNSDAVMAPGVFRGAEGLREYRALIESMWEQLRFEPLEYIPAGDDAVVVPIRLVGVGRDGIEITARSTLVARMREGKLAGSKSFQEEADAFAAAGLSHEP